MYAVFAAGGKQHRVEVGSLIDVEKVEDIVLGEFVLFEGDRETSDFWSTSLKRRMEKKINVWQPNL